MLTTVEQAAQQREAELKGELERQAKAVAEAEAKRKTEEAERQRLAAVKAEQERQAREAAAAEAKRKTEEAEQQRLAVLKAEQDRQARAAQDAEAKRKAEAERIAAAKAQEEMQARAAAEAKARFAQQQPITLGCQAAYAAEDRLRFDILPETSVGVKAIQVRAWNTQVVIQDISVSHVGDVQSVSHLIALQNRLVAANAATAPIRLENDSKPLSLVLVAYGSGERRGSAPPSMCIEGLK